MISRGRGRFLMTAVWAPVVVFVVLTFIEQLNGSLATLSGQQQLLIYGLAFGVPAYIVFALWATRTLSGKPEQQILKRIWRAPLMFIPFYAVPWVLYGLANVLTGDFAGVAMMFGWLVFLPYLLIAGYVVSGLTVALYRTLFS